MLRIRILPPTLASLSYSRTQVVGTSSGFIEQTISPDSYGAFNASRAKRGDGTLRSWVQHVTPRPLSTPQICEPPMQTAYSATNKPWICL